jgi:hypothetical protein
MSLLTEGFAKKLIVASLEVLAKKTESTWDDEVLKSVKESWGLAKPE